MQIETFTMVHPEHPDCVGDAATLAAWAPLGWERKDEHKPEHKADHKHKAK